MSFVNKVVIITGAASGIGAVTANYFVKEGADVAIIDVDEEKLNKVAEDCAKIGKQPLIIKADLTNEAQSIINKVLNVFGKLDVLVNNAGVIRKGTILDGDLMDTFDEQININLRAVMLMTTLAAEHLVVTKGNVVNVSSICSMRVQTNMFTAYTVSKAGVDQFTRCAARELAPAGVRVNSVNPSGTKTSLYENAGFTNQWDKTAKAAPLQRVLEPEEVAELILYLASDKAKNITGVSYAIDGGLFIK